MRKKVLFIFAFAFAVAAVHAGKVLYQCALQPVNGRLLNGKL